MRAADTSDGRGIPARLVWNYMDRMVNQFFKILPLRESGEPSLYEFMRSLLLELEGYGALMRGVKYDAMYMTLLATLRYLIDAGETCEVHEVRREVFKAISICKKLRDKYGEEAR